MKIHLFADMLGGYGGIETYLDALARRLHAEGRDFTISACLNAPAPFLADLAELGIPVYLQPRVPGDRWHVRQRLLAWRVARHSGAGDWIYCVRQPMPAVYLGLVRAAHRRGARVAASWMFAPEFLQPGPDGAGHAFRTAVAETDAVISVSECTRTQFERVYGYCGPVHVVRYHNRLQFPEPLPLPPAPPYQIGYLGRIDISQKNLDTIVTAFASVAQRRADVRLNLHGGGPDGDRLAHIIARLGMTDRVTLHGPYDHRRDLARIIAANHVFIHTSRFEGGPCFSLLELLQGGRFVIASPVGGIPDIYDQRPEIGTMVPADQPEAIAHALAASIDRIEKRPFDMTAMRKLYDEQFSDAVAHRQWLGALGLT
jgi:glycosyltransferase involved in cell wall biosynthesis